MAEDLVVEDVVLKNPADITVDALVEGAVNDPTAEVVIKASSPP